MCGIAGYLKTGAPERDTTRLVAALRAMAHRGPDDEGVVIADPARRLQRSLSTDGTAAGVSGLDATAGSRSIPHRLALGHRRFSIVDVSPAAHQPFWSTGGEVCVAFHGEVYNYVEVRTALEREGRQFRTTSDTEVLVEAYLAWGESFLERLNGFWAMSLHDARSGGLLLARDRIGKAPLYVTDVGGGLHWASEIKGLAALVGADRFSVRPRAVADFMRWNRRDILDETFYEQVRSFPAGSRAWIRADGRYQAVRYWQLPESRLKPSDVSIAEAGRELRDLLGDAVRIRRRADVPVAAQLSGGMDSSSIVALTATQEAGITAFTVNFPGEDVDEEPFARLVAEHHRDRLDYVVIQPPDAELLDDADAYVSLMDEPFHSPNQFTNQQVWRRMTRDGFRVNLYGAGGDEVFAGYSWDYYRPYLAKLLAGGRFARLAREFFMFSERRRGALGLHHVRRAAGLLKPRSRGASVPPELDPITLRGVRAQDGPPREIDALLRAQMTGWQMSYWLHVDNQNSMGVPIELRSPLLDYRVVELGFRLPLEYLIRDGWMKWILRQSMTDRLPDAITWRRQKRGFPFPLQSWLQRSRPRILKMVDGVDSPFLDAGRLRDNYDGLRATNPQYLWSVISLAFWWKRCVQGESLSI